MKHISHKNNVPISEEVKENNQNVIVCDSRNARYKIGIVCDVCTESLAVHTVPTAITFEVRIILSAPVARRRK